jgi:hypothetical protein
MPLLEQPDASRRQGRRLARNSAESVEPVAIIAS